MPDKRSKFHEFALRSILFKGRSDWYFCYLKAERIAHVLALLEANFGGSERQRLTDMGNRAAGLPADIAHLAAGEIEAPVVLADVFALLSAVRLCVTEGLINKETGTLLEREYEQVGERLMQGSHPSPFVGAGDFELPPLPLPDAQMLGVSLIGHQGHGLRDSIKVSNDQEPKGHSDRTERILEFIRKQKSASIKDIAATVKGCSEKTIQRELNTLIKEGLVKRVGERRWSQYLPA